MNYVLPGMGAIYIARVKTVADAWILNKRDHSQG
jgi:hypothetical protein